MSRRTTFLAPLVLAVVAGGVFLVNLGGSRLWDDDEPKNAACGREMLDRGDWIVPTFNDELRPHKPILLYWAMIASYRAVGVSELGARLPSALAGLGSVFFCFMLGRLLFDRLVGFAAGVLLASGLMFAVLARAATPDAILILCSTAALYFFVWGVASLRGGSFSGAGADDSMVSLDRARLPVRAAAAMYASMGLAVLAKGPIGILLPTLVLGCYAVLLGRRPQEPPADLDSSRTKRLARWLGDRLAWRRVLRIAMNPRAPLGAVVVLAVAAPWYTAVTLATDGQWLLGFLGTHNVHRFLHPMEGHSGPIFYYVLAIMAGFFPGSCFLPVAVVQAVRDTRRNLPLAESQALLLCWLGAYLVFFSLAATKLPNYIAPCYPALALLTAYWLVGSLRAAAPPLFWLRLGTASFAVVGLAMTIGLGIAAMKYLDGDLVVALVGLAPLAGGVAGLAFLQRRRVRPALVALASGGVAFTILATSLVAARVSPYQTSPRVASRLADLQVAQGHDLRFATFQYTKPNLVFYLGQPVAALDSDDEAARFLAGDPRSVLVLPGDQYARLRPRLPADAVVLHAQPKFLKPDQEVVVVGRRANLAQAPRDPDSSRQ